MQPPTSARASRRLAGALCASALLAAAACGGDASGDADADGTDVSGAASDADSELADTANATDANTNGASGDRGCIDDYEPGTDYFNERVEPVHSELWDISYHGSYKVLSVPDTEFPDQPDLQYVLVQCGAPEPDLSGELADAAVFEVPVERTAINHDNALGMLEQIGVTDTIVGMSDEMLSFRDQQWYAEIIESAQDPQNLGTGDGVDYERTLGIEPDILVMAGYGPGYTNVSDEVERGLPAIMVANRVEPDPLGSAEWMKFLSAFYNAEAKANTAFGEIEANYQETVESVTGSLPEDYTVAYLCIDPDWGCEFVYAHGPESLNGRIIETLGATNPFAEGNSAGNGQNFDFEQALARGTDIDFIVNYDPIGRVEATLTDDDRFDHFTAFANGNYITYQQDTYAYCQANLYVRVDTLIRDYAIGIAPDLFPDDRGECFAAPG